MEEQSKNVYQFKITLEGIKPPIWRRIQVPGDYTFWDLHVAIQDSMGWTDSHLHEFEIVNPKYGEYDQIGIPDNMSPDRVAPGWKKKIASYFSLGNKRANYYYDFGDDWQHRIVLEKILPQVPEQKYPICIDGARACPPEDCGGIWGYEEILDILNNPNHKEYESTLEWVGKPMDPEEFKVEQVIFEDPKERLKMSINII